MASIAAVTHSYVFGLKSDIKENIQFVDEGTILYPAGSNLVLYPLDQKTQKFIPVSEMGDSISAISLSLNKKFLAIAERGVNSTMPLVVIYDLVTMRRKKVLQISEGDSKEIVSLCMSCDAKYVVTQTGAPDWTLTYWNWEKGKILGSVRSSNVNNAPVTHVSFNPHDITQVCVTGDGIFKLYRYSEGMVKQFGFQKIEVKTIHCHSWLSEDRVAVALDEGQIFLFESGEHKATFNIFESESEISKKTSILSLLSYSKGFAYGTSHGIIGLFERTEDKELYRKSREFKLKEDNVKITSLALSPSEDNLICGLETNQMYAISLSNVDIKAEELQMDLVAQPFHHGQITGLDTCLRKPLIVTCSNDRSVRLWNYLDNSIELVKYFPEEAYSVALHPSGLLMLVGFNDKLRLMNILIDDIRPYKEFTIRGCRECRFSNGGQYFAAVHGNTIQIFSTWTFENIGNLKGHNGKVRSVYFSSDDSRIISAGMDGAVYDWSMKDLKRDGENVLKSCSYTCAIASPDGHSLFAVGSDKMIKEIKDSQIVKEIESDVVLTQVVMSHSGKMMFGGTTKGAIRSLKYPFTEESLPTDFQEHQAHSMAVTKMRISFDDQYLFTTSEDGTFYIFKINDKEGRALKRDADVTFAEEILVTKSDLEEKNSMMAELKTRVDELKLENEYQLRLKDMTYNEKIKDITEKFTQEIEALKITRSVLKTDKEKEQVRHEEEMAEVRDKHQRELQELEAVNNQKLMNEFEKYQDLQKKLTDLQHTWENQLRDTKSMGLREAQNIKEQFEEKILERQSEIDQLQEEMKLQLKEFEETVKEIEEDADTEIVEMKVKYEKKLKDEREASLRLKGENGIMKKKFSTLQKEIDEHKSEIQRMFQEEKKLHSVIKSLEKDIIGLKKEIQERDETIQDKEKRIYDLKKKNQELEKFKFVLDYKIKELKKQIEPKEKEIIGMTQQIKEMDDELELYNKQKTSMELNLHDINLKLKASEKEKLKEKRKATELEFYIKRFQKDLHHTAQLIQKPQELKEEVTKMFHLFCTKMAKKQELDAEIQQENVRQREHLERTVFTLRKKLYKDGHDHKYDNIKIMQENVSLIGYIHISIETREINQLRKEIKGMRQREKAIDIKLPKIGSTNAILGQ